MMKLKNIWEKIYTAPVIFYRKFISPLKRPSCKYYPTCSTYALTALKRFGLIKGTILSVNRILRCNPWSMGGIDPVPEEYHLFKKNKKENN